MKKTVLFILILGLLLSLSACKSNDVKMVEELIYQIGEISVDSEVAVTKAEMAYNNLTEKDQKKVANYNLLVEAREALQVCEITIDNWDDYFKIEKTITDFKYEESYFSIAGASFVESASAKLNVRITKKVDCKAKNISFNLGLMAYDDNWNSYDDLEHVTLTEDGCYEGSFYVHLKNDVSMYTFMLKEPGFSVLLGDLSGQVITVKN